MTPFLIIAIVPWVVMAIALLDALRHPRTRWELADQDQMLWTIVILSGGFIPVIGPLVYLLVARPRLRSVDGWTPVTTAPVGPSTAGSDVR